jgi:hypothetical protein
MPIAALSQPYCSAMEMMLTLMLTRSMLHNRNATKHSATCVHPAPCTHAAPLAEFCQRTILRQIWGWSSRATQSWWSRRRAGGGGRRLRIRRITSRDDVSCCAEFVRG